MFLKIERNSWLSLYLCVCVSLCIETVKHVPHYIAAHVKLGWLSRVSELFLTPWAWSRIFFVCWICTAGWLACSVSCPISLTTEALGIQTCTPHPAHVDLGNHTQHLTPSWQGLYPLTHWPNHHFHCLGLGSFIFLGFHKSKWTPVC